MKEKLELKHLAPYLPYGLRIQIPAKYNFSGLKIKAEPELWVVDGLKSDYIHFVNIAGFYPIQHFKYVLRPLSYLTKEIEVNGERFVPKEVMFDKYKIINGTHSGFGVEINKVFEVKGYDKLAHWIYQDLIKWHFDVFNLIEKGLAIDINTLK